jgi:hypothetical protein
LLADLTDEEIAAIDEAGAEGEPNYDLESGSFIPRDPLRIIMAIQITGCIIAAIVFVTFMSMLPEH